MVVVGVVVLVVVKVIGRRLLSWDGVAGVDEGVVGGGPVAAGTVAGCRIRGAVVTWVSADGAALVLMRVRGGIGYWMRCW